MLSLMIKLFHNYKVRVNIVEQNKKQVHSAKSAMRWGEMDALGHMNNVSYFRYFEESRISWFNSFPLNYNSEGDGPILGTITCKFIKPAIYPVFFKVNTSISRLGNSTFTMWTDICDDSDETICFASAEAIMVWINIASGQAVRVPNWFRRMF